MDLPSLRRLVARGENATLEFKRSTGELREALEALCGMLNGAGRGQAVFGVTDGGDIPGQSVSEKTLREIANVSRRIEPTADFSTASIGVRGDLAVLVVEARAGALVGHAAFDWESSYLVASSAICSVTH